SGFPPSLQWIGTTPVLFPFIHLVFLGLGLPFGLAAIAAMITVLIRWITRRDTHHMAVLALFILFMFAHQSLQFAKAMRYLLPVYPSIAVLTAWWIMTMYKRFKPHRAVVIIGIIVLQLWPIACISMYLQPHSRVAASTWIYAHIPKGATIAWEHWDDPLPLRIGDMTIYEFQTNQLPLFNPESPSKWTKIAGQLEQSDYIILSSNRVYAGTGNATARFPQTQRYYAQLFSGTLGFTLVAQFVSRPTIPVPGISACLQMPFFSYGRIAQKTDTCTQPGVAIVDDYVDETFTVYDHPKVLIFRNTGRLTATQLFNQIYGK
ncbi:MAG: hypothetical protein AAB276_06650, partial [Pseudomonadota bacterium]